MKNNFRITDLTPIEYHDGVYFKRDDLYAPFEDLPELSGGKLRMMQMLLEFILNNKQWKYKGIMTYSSVSSPQAVIVARIAYEYNIPCIICVGVNEMYLEESIEKHLTLSYSKKYNAKIVSISSIGFNSVLKERSSKIAKKLNYFLIDFGLNVERQTYATIKGVINQVQNIPTDIDNIIIPCGSAISMAGILVGLKLFNKKVKRVIGIQIAGHDRHATIENILSQFNIKSDYEFIIDKTYKYQHHLKNYINNDFEMSWVYEAKAYEYYKNNKKELKINENEKTLFWCIGCNNFLLKNNTDEEKSKNIKENTTYKIHVDNFKKLVNPCNCEMINSHCLAECCKKSFLKLGQPAIILLQEEHEKFLELSKDNQFGIDESLNLLKPEDKCCPFQDQYSNICKLHNTEIKPFGCSIMPVEILKNVIKVQNYFPKMNCQKTIYKNVERVPFYIGFKQSLVAVFGEIETERIISEIESGNEDISVNISQSTVEKMIEVKKSIRKLSKANKHISD